MLRIGMMQTTLRRLHAKRHALACSCPFWILGCWGADGEDSGPRPRRSVWVLEEMLLAYQPFAQTRDVQSSRV